MKNKAIQGAMLALLALAAMACSDDSNKGECATSAACDTYTTCVSGACVPLECVASTDCPTTDVCVQNTDGDFVCTAIECTSDDQCSAEGAICLQNICVLPGTATCAADGEVCQFANDCCSKQCDGETKLCVPFTGCTEDGDCEEGETCGPTGECVSAGPAACTPETCDGNCNEETGECEPAGTGPSICSPCTTDEDCGAAGGCVTSEDCNPACRAVSPRRTAHRGLNASTCHQEASDAFPPRLPAILTASPDVGKGKSVTWTRAIVSPNWGCVTPATRNTCAEKAVGASMGGRGTPKSVFRNV